LRLRRKAEPSEKTLSSESKYVQRFFNDDLLRIKW